MKINDTVYIVHQDHICRCTIKGIQEDLKEELFYNLMNHYTGKEMPFLMPEGHVFETISELITKHMDDHYKKIVKALKHMDDHYV